MKVESIGSSSGIELDNTKTIEYIKNQLQGLADKQNISVDQLLEDVSSLNSSNPSKERILNLKRRLEVLSK